MVPVAINGTREAMPVGKTIPGRGTVTVEFLPAIYPKKRDENKIAALVQKAVSDKVH